MNHWLLLCSFSAVLAGCAPHAHTLVQGSASGFLKGELIHSRPSRLVLDSGGRQYVAEGFEVKRHHNLADLHKRYSMSEPRHWDRIGSGLDRDHDSFTAEPKLKTSNGEELNCKIAWRTGSSPKGVCIDGAGNEFPITFN